MRTRRSQSSSDSVPRETRRRPDFSGEHKTVLLHEAIDCLGIEPGDIVVDATLGGAGHAREIAAKLGSGGLLIGLDLDRDAVARAQERLAGAAPRVVLRSANFRDLEAVLRDLGIDHVTKVLFDLGWSSYQLDSGRGFSFQSNEPLQMTYAQDPEPGAPTASTIVNDWGEESIADVIFGWGGERYARRIAKRIVEYREKKRIETSRELAEIVRSAVPAAYRRGRIHPATKTFQALRIAVNDELGAVREGIAAAWRRLSPGGRIAVISFHSLEDREVKRLFAELARESGRLLFKKPLRPSLQELAENPRSRSAKLRSIEKSP